MNLLLENALLNASDGFVQSGSKIWYHFNKYEWDLKNQFDNNYEGEKRRVIKSRLSKGLSDASEASRLFGTYHLGITPHIYSYYHLITDLLDHLIKSPRYPVLVPTFMPISYINFLKEVGFKIHILPPKIFTVENLFIPDIKKAEWSKDKVKNIQDFFNKILPSKASSNIQKSQKKIYISRELAKKRHLSNEKEFLPILRKHNFKKVFLENMSIPKQVELFRSISHVIGPHGAGLTNVLFAPFNTKILEIRPVLNSGQFCFENLFSFGWFNYEIIVPAQTGHFFLPIEKLEEVLSGW